MRRLALVLILLVVACGKVHQRPVTTNDILILGDSLAHGAGDETGRGIGGAIASLTRAHVENYGINGARTTNVLRQLQRSDVRAAIRRAQLIVVSIGGNDLFGNSIERFGSMLAPRVASYFVAARVARVVARVHRENPSAQIVVLGLYNPYRQAKFGAWLDEQIARWDARIIDGFARSRAVTVIRIADLIDTPRAISPLDHYHPSASGYRAIAQRICAAFDIAPESSR